MMHYRFLFKPGKVVGFILLGIISTTLSIHCIAPDHGPLTAFSTGGHSVYYLQPATINKGGKRAIVAATFDGTVLCYTPDGKPIWEKKINNFFPFDLAVADIDNDGLDEIFVATAGGTVNAFNVDGTHLWTFSTKAPLYQVCPIRTSSGEWVILTGGIEEEVFSLSSKGVLLNSFNAGDVVRHIRKGDIAGSGKEYAAVATTSSGLGGKLSLILLDPETLNPLWSISDLGSSSHNSGKRFFSMIVFDLNHDGRQDIVLGGSWGDHGRILGFDYKGKQILDSSDPMVPSRAYQMNLLTRVNLKDSIGENIFGIFGKYLIIYNRDGKIQTLLESRYDFSNGTFDSQTSTYYLGSSPSGGDGIYALHLNQKGWQKAFEEIRPVGKLLQVEKNIDLLKDQIARFKRPDYQRSPAMVSLSASKPKGATFDNLQFSSHLLLSEEYGDRSELWCRNIDKRRKYNMTSDEILSLVRAKEANGEDFLIIAGHGTAFYISPETMEKVLLVAPKHFHGFLFTEMEHVDSAMQEVVIKIIFPLAEKCSSAGKKIFLNSKNVFWNGSCYVDFWKEILLNPEFSDVFVPNLEETNCRTQELSLAGREGLWLAGSFDNWAIRVVDDNACFDRMWEWSSQEVISHFLRQLVLQSSLGADYLSIDVAPWLRDQLLPVYEMLEKGVIVIPEKDELLSVSDLCLGMMSPPSNEYITHGTNGHNYNFNEVSATPLVFDRLDCYWGAAPIQDHDFSSYGYGCDRRMLNFLPKNPYGLVAIVPDDINLTKFPRFKEKVSTDGQYFYDSTGLKHGPAEYKQIMLRKLKQSAARLPVLVKGDVAWSVVRLDPNHVRVTLVDPGYTDPADRNAEIVLQHLTGLECTDILSGEKLEISDQKVHLQVSAGIFRIIDIAH